MLLNPDRYWWLIPTSFLLAFLWQFWPIPLIARAYLPDALVMVTIYWTLRRPRQISSGWAFIIGFCRDGIDGSPLGMHALALVVVSYAVQLLHQQLRLLVIWQQSLAIGALCLTYLLIGSWVQLLHSPPVNTPVLWIPAATACLAWPVCYLMLLRLEEGASRTPIRP